MATTKFTTISFPINTLLGQIETGQIGLPELQRPFVWERTQVRDLLDSLYRGYPAGFFLMWEARQGVASQPIGANGKQASPSLLVVDGQQRLTSLYAVFRGAPVFNDKFEEIRIRIAFNPVRERFEVSNSAIASDPEWVQDVSELLSGPQGSFAFVNEYLERLKRDRELTPEQTDRIATRLQDLADLNNYTFDAIQLSHEVPIEEVSEVFVRVNSKGTQLNQADFILTLMSVHWDEGRKQLEEFCRAAKTPSAGASPFNWFISPSPDQLLRVGIGLGHRRAILKYAYEIMRGKDLESGEVTHERRAENFEILQKSQQQVLDLTNFTEYLKSLQQAGFRSGKMITSKHTIVYCYLIFLIGRADHSIDFKTLRSAIARWFFMCVLTSRYTGSPESQVEKDLRMLADATSGDEFVSTLDATVARALTDDFWTITLPDLLSWSGGYIPAMFSYFASLNMLGAKVLFSDLTVHELLDPAQAGKKSAVEKHHLFPRDYLKSIGIKKVQRINQVANYALLEWPDNIKIGASAPADYFQNLFEESVPPSEREQSRFVHALPAGWEDMDYEVFLEARRSLMADVIRGAFKKLSTGSVPDEMIPSDQFPKLAELIEAGESLNVEFKSSVWFSYRPDVPEKVISGGILKTIAALLNSEGGTLVIGIDDDGKPLGLQPDFDLKRLDADKFENALTTLFINAVGTVAAKRCKIRFEKLGNNLIALIDVEKSPKPIYAKTDKGKETFYIRAGNTTRILEGREIVEYIGESWGLS